MKTQTDRILDLLRSRGSAGLTTLEALEEAQCFRLASRVNDLRKSGHAITTHMVELPSGKRIARYEITNTEDVCSSSTSAHGPGIAATLITEAA
jgi:hypothetical protein